MEQIVREGSAKYLLDRYGESLCYHIYNTKNDVSYDYYRTVFEGYQWNLDEILRPIPGYEGLYSVSWHGTVYSHKRNKVITPCGGNSNYQVVCIKNPSGIFKTEYVHRLVAKAWVPNPDNLPEVNHKNEKKDFNWASNLEWCTRSYNIRYSNIGTRNKKEVYCLETDTVYDSLTQASRELGVQASNISLVCKGKLKSTGGYRFKYV